MIRLAMADMGSAKAAEDLTKILENAGAKKSQSPDCPDFTNFLMPLWKGERICEIRAICGPHN